MKSVLLPSDLTLQSLYPIHQICEEAGEEKVNIYIIHTLTMPNGIMDLLFQEERKPYNQVPDQFREALEMLRVKYASVVNVLSFEFVWGNSRAYLRNYLAAREVEQLFLMEGHEYRFSLRQSVDPIPALLRCKVPVTYAGQRKGSKTYGTLTTLLINRTNHVTEEKHTV